MTIRAAIVLFLSCVAPVFAQSQTKQGDVDLETARLLAFQLVAEARFNEAAGLAKVLLEADTEDQAAWLALSQAQRGQGRFEAALASAKHAFSVSKNDTEKYSSSLVAAQALASADKNLRAQFWLRRAAHYAPDASLRQQAESGFRYVRSATPHSLSFRLSVAPSSNINNGAKSDTATFLGLQFQLTGSAQALSGVEYQFGGTWDYSHQIDQRRKLTFGIEFDSSRYSLSSSAKALAPDLRASDLAFDEVSAKISTQQVDRDGGGATDLGFSVGKSWYGGNALSWFARVGVDRRQAAGANNVLAYGLSVERQTRLDNSIRSATVWSAYVSYDQTLKNSDALRVSAFASDTASDSAVIAHDSFGFALNYQFAQPVVAETFLSLSLGSTWRSYDRKLIIADGVRHDQVVSASAQFTIKDLDYFGFAPTATLRASRTDSNVDLYETEEVGISLGLRSSF